MRNLASLFSPPPATRPDGADAARAAQRTSTARFMEAVHQGPEVRRIGQVMKESRIRNSYPERLEDALSRRGTLGL